MGLGIYRIYLIMRLDSRRKKDVAWLDVTTFKDMKVGDQVNLEIDVLARYMEGLLSSRSDLLSGKQGK